MPAVIFFDLDGVLADFVSGALCVHGHRRPDVLASGVRWGIEEQLGLDPAAFWAPLGFDFWAGLAPYADGLALLAWAESLVGAGRVGLLTSPCQTAGCVEGKRAWVGRHLPGYRARLFVGGAKHLVAGPGKVLVDDHDANCDAFAAAGGRAVQPPRPWNRRAGGATAGCAGVAFDVGPLTAELSLAVAAAE